jgi:hypothetical protein
MRTSAAARLLAASAALAAGGALLAAPAPAPPPAAPPRLPPERALPPRTIPQALGFNLHVLGPDKDLDAIRDAGVKFVRKDLFWNHAERGRGSYDFGGFERMLDGLEKRGIRALFILCYQNELYPRPENNAEGREAYAKFAAAAAKRFKGRRVLWELWNEPNVMHFWKGPGDHNSDAFADQYVALVKAAVPAMREADPDCYILGGAVSCLWTNSFKWIDRCFKQGLLTSGIDALSVHPYGFARPELCIQEGYGHLREMMAAAGAPKDFPVLNSEVGYDVNEKYLGPPELRLQHQAWHFVRQHLVDQLCDIRLSIWYNWNDDPGFRIAAPDLSDLPVTVACRTLAAQLNGFRFASRIPLKSEQDFALLFEKDTGERKLVAWTTPQGRDETPEKAKVHDVAIPVGTTPTGTLKTFDLSGKEGTAREADGAVTLALSGSPQYVELRGKGASRPVSPLTVRADPRPRPEVPRETLAAWEAKLQARLREVLKSGKKPKFAFEAMGGEVEAVAISDAAQLSVRGGGNVAQAPWSAMSTQDRTGLAVGLAAATEDPADFALAAFYSLAFGSAAKGESFLARLGGKEAQSVRDALK